MTIPNAKGPRFPGYREMEPEEIIAAGDFFLTPPGQLRPTISNGEVVGPECVGRYFRPVAPVPAPEMVEYAGNEYIHTNKVQSMLANFAREQVEDMTPKDGDGPDWACPGCGNTDKNRFKTVQVCFDSPNGPAEYDLECEDCGGHETQESPREALHMMADIVESQSKAITNLQAQVQSLMGALEAARGALAGLLQLAVAAVDLCADRIDTSNDPRLPAARAALILLESLSLPLPKSKGGA